MAAEIAEVRDQLTYYYYRVCNASKSQVYSYTEQPEFALNQAAFEVRPLKLFQILIPMFEGVDGAVRHEQ